MFDNLIRHDPNDGARTIIPDLAHSWEITTDGKTWKIPQGIKHNEFAQQKIDATLSELRSERDTIKDLLG